MSYDPGKKPGNPAACGGGNGHASAARGVRRYGLFPWNLPWVAIRTLPFPGEVFLFEARGLPWGDSLRHHRRSIRLPGYDYAQAGGYFVTFCTWRRECVFGDVVKGEMVLSPWGEIVQQEWLATPDIRQEIELDAFVVMPNHIHGIIWIVGATPTIEADGAPVGAHGRAPLPDASDELSLWRPPRSLGSFVAGYKSAVTKQVNVLRSAPGARLWQRGYWEHIIRHERALERIREYILTNPQRWEWDRENPQRRGEDDFDRWLDSYARGGDP